MAELDDAYANAAYIPDADGFLRRWPRIAAAFRDTCGARYKRRAYGPGARHWFDLFLPEEDTENTLIFVHGGYWLRFDPSYWSHLAAGALARGWAVAMPCYDLCPDAGIHEITQQLAAAVESVAWQRNGKLSLAGHSAGGHLVARMLAPGLLIGDTMARLTHVVPISPVTDLRPLLRTSMNADFKLDQAAAIAESPVFQPKPSVAVAIWVGADERPVFLDHARWLKDAWACDEVIVPGAHHFDIIDALADPSSDMVQRLTG
ncbi:MAG: alpha/beta hydrolase [Pseudomonadota bacterium]